MEENKPLRRSTRILKKIEQQLHDGGTQEKQESDSEFNFSRENSEEEDEESQIPIAPEPGTRNRDEPPQRFIDPYKAVGTSTVDELSMAVTQNLVQIKETLDEKILGLQKLFDEKLSVIRRTFDGTVVDIHQNLDKLWNATTKTTERMDATERYTKNLGECLQERLDESTQRIEESVMVHQRKMEERLNTVGTDLLGRIDAQNRGLTREIEILKLQVREGQQNHIVEPFAGMVPNHHPFAARHQSPQTPVTASSRAQATPGHRQATDFSDDFIAMEDFGNDFWSSPEGRRDDFDRRNSLGGGSIFSAILAPAEASNTYMISSVTRETYAGVVLRDITLDSVGPFMNHYLNIKRKHPGQAWMIVDFCSEYTKQELTVLADTYELPGTTLGLGGAFALNDRQVLFLILEKLKARSMDDFVTRLQSLRFLEEDSGIDYTKQENYDKLFRAALNFRFRFVMRVQLLGSRAKAEHIPPLHKMGQTPGLLTFFFNAWPAGTGKSLFSRHFTPEMRSQTDLKGFFKIFFSKLNAYRDVKQGYDDLGSVLSSQQREKEGDGQQVRFRDEKPYVKREAYPSHPHQPISDQRNHEDHRTDQRDRKTLRPPGYDATKRLWIPERERREDRQRSLQYMSRDDEEVDDPDSEGFSWYHGMEQRGAEQEDEAVLEEHSPGDERQFLNALDNGKANSKKGCFWKYMYGECTKKDCAMDHRDEVIQGMWKKKVWDLVKAAKTPGGEVLVSELQRALRDAQAVTNSNTRA